MASNVVIAHHRGVYNNGYAPVVGTPVALPTEIWDRIMQGVGAGVLGAKNLIQLGRTCTQLYNFTHFPLFDQIIDRGALAFTRWVADPQNSLAMHRVNGRNKVLETRTFSPHV